VAEAREADTCLKALRWEADAAARLAAQQLEAAAGDAAALRRQVDTLAHQGDAQVSDLLSDVVALRQQLAQQREEASLAAARGEARREEEAAAARQRLQQAQGGCARAVPDGVGLFGDTLFGRVRVDQQASSGLTADSEHAI
jgi:hypothetical protein